MSRGPKAVALELTEAERAELRRLLRRRGVGQALAQRVRVVLACAEPGATNLGVARALGQGAGRAPPDAGWRRGAGASPSTGWRGWWTHRVRERRAASATRRSSAWSP